LGAQLGEVEVGARFIAVVHCLAELALGVVAVEDDAVDGDGDGLDNDFDDAADDGPGLGVVSWLAVDGEWRRSLLGYGKLAGSRYHR
jgi:hypothetical protein